MSPFGASRHIVPPHDLGRFVSKADMAIVTSRHQAYGYTA
jgi:hypothetical protein